MKQKYILPLVLVIDIIILLYETFHLSISYNEARLYFGQFNILSYCIHFFTALFGQNDFALRLFMILLHIGSVILFYKLTAYYLKQYKERLIVTIIFIFLPGILSSALIVNSAGIVIFLTLLFIYIFKKYNFHTLTYIYLFLIAFIDKSFSLLFLSLAFFGFYQKNKDFALFNIGLVVLNLFIYYTDIGGYPTGHFLDSLAIYAAIFSPVIFVYTVYALYRVYITKQIDIIWFIATIPFLYSLLLSLRQYVHIEYYAPFVIMGLFLAAKIFVNSYKVRLKVFRKNYRLLFSIAIAFLVLNFIVVIANQYLYIFLKNPKKHFTYKHHIAKELASKLHDLDINCIHTDYKMQLRLKFYGISDCQKYTLSPFPSTNSKKVTISYINKIVYENYVTKLNNK